MSILCLVISLGVHATPGVIGSPSGDGHGDEASVEKKNILSISDTKSYILEQARKQLAKRLPGDNYRYQIQARWIPSRLLRQSPDQITGLQLRGEIRRYTNFEVTYLRRGDRRQIEIQIKVEVEQNIPVVIKRLRKGSALSEENLAKQWVSITKNRGTYITSTDKLIGKTLRRTLLSGQPVPRSYISRDLIIRAGDEVKVVIEQNGVQVQVTGEAREDGAKGERIKVYSNETRRKYEGKIIRPGVIQWKNTL